MSELSEGSGLKKSSEFDLQWLEAQGEFEEEKAQGHPYISKNKSQATYLSERGGALTIDLDGQWHYLVKTESFSSESPEGLHDSVRVESVNGILHELDFEISLSEGEAKVASVHYNVHKPKAELVQEEESVVAIPAKDDENEILTPESLAPEHNHVQLQEDVEAVTDEDESGKEEDMLEPVSEVMIEEEEASVDAEAMLSKVQERIREKTEAEAQLQAQKDMEEASESASEIEADDHDEEEIEDEMLLKVKALMQAKENIDISDIEFTGEPKLEEVPIEEEGEEQSSDLVPEQVEETSNEHEASRLESKIEVEGMQEGAVFKNLSYVEGFELAPDGSFVYAPDDISHEYLSVNSSHSYHVDIECEGLDGTKLKGSIELQVMKKEQGYLLSFSQGDFFEVKQATLDEASQRDDMEVAEIAQEHFHEDSFEEDDLSHGGLRVEFDSEIKDGLHSDGTLGVTIYLPAGAQSGESVSINGMEFIINEAEAQAGKLLYSVDPDEEIEVSFTDSDNNTLDSVRAKAHTKSIELLEFYDEPKLTGEVGSQSMHAKLGAFTEASWGVMGPHKKVGVTAEGSFGSVHIDAQTSELEYIYREHSGLDKYGSSADTTVHENFLIYKAEEPYADLEVTLHIYAQSIHGYSGHQIDSSSIKQMKLLKVQKKPQETQEKEQMKEMLLAGLENNKQKIAKVMMEIYEAKSKGEALEEAKEKLQALTDQKVHLEDKIESLN